MMLRKRSTLLRLAAVASFAAAPLVACGGERPPVTPQANAAEVALSAQDTLRPAATTAGDAIVIAPDLGRLCGVDNAESAPKFEFDSARLAEAAREPLEALATCLSSGPLAGKRVMLVGHADPRGTESYNFALGRYRAVAVAQFLEGLGVSKSALETTSRGELDARGYDEATWAVDRRVDISLAAR